MVVARRLSVPEMEPALVARARAGDAEAFDLLMGEHAETVRRLVRRFVPNTDDASDVEQETWIRAFSRLESLREPSRFRPWLRSIARSSALNFISSRKRQDARVRAFQTYEDDQVEEFEDAASPTPESAALSRDDRRRVVEALGSLSTADRQVLHLRESQRLSYEELAQELSITVNAAQVRVFRARERLRRLFREMDDAAPARCGTNPLLISELVDAELDDEAAGKLRAHIMTCNGCQSRYTTMQAGQMVYRHWSVLAVPLAPEGGLLTALSEVASRVAALLGIGGSGAGAGAAAASSAAGTGAVGGSVGAVVAGAAATGTAVTTAGVVAAGAASVAGGAGVVAGGAVTSTASGGAFAALTAVIASAAIVSGGGMATVSPAPTPEVGVPAAAAAGITSSDPSLSEGETGAGEATAASTVARSNGATPPYGVASSTAHAPDRGRASDGIGGSSSRRGQSGDDRSRSLASGVRDAEEVDGDRDRDRGRDRDEGRDRDGDRDGRDRDGRDRDGRDRDGRDRDGRDRDGRDRDGRDRDGRDRDGRDRDGRDWDDRVRGGPSDRGRHDSGRSEAGQRGQRVERGGQATPPVHAIAYASAAITMGRGDASDNRASNDRGKHERGKGDRDQYDRGKDDRGKDDRGKHDRDQHDRGKDDRGKHDRDKHDRDKHDRDKHDRDKHDRGKHDRDKHDRDRR